MNLKQALEQQVQIKCTTTEEKTTVLNILHLNNVTADGDDLEKENCIISLYVGDSYDIFGEDIILEDYPMISAADFIASNSAPTYTLPTPESMNIH